MHVQWLKRLVREHSQNTRKWGECCQPIQDNGHVSVKHLLDERELPETQLNTRDNSQIPTNCGLTWIGAGAFLLMLPVLPSRLPDAGGPMGPDPCAGPAAAAAAAVEGACSRVPLGGGPRESPLIRPLGRIKGWFLVRPAK